MKFERLRLTGFKSFCDAADFKIEPGLTGVVGPNGCGKSNLVEALRWVMGETSFKNMRGSGMEDVIFAGSGRRPSRNNAEVGLLLDNSDRRAPAAFNDAETIEVTRRIEREAGSTYRVNGKEVRARDVQLLFADASTGARSPSLVRQGQIGEIISAKPQARRLILEEAAGISGLHSRRHEAELQAQGRGGQSAARRGRAEADRRPDRQPEAAGAPVEPLPHARRRHPPPRGARPSHRLARARGRLRRGARAGSTRTSSKSPSAPARKARPRACRRSPPPALPALREEEARARRGAAPHCARARGARSRGEARQGARGRTRAPHRPIRPRPRARGGADRRRGRPWPSGSPPRMRARRGRRPVRRRSRPKRASARRAPSGGSQSAEAELAEAQAAVSDLNARRHALGAAAAEEGRRLARLEAELRGNRARAATLCARRTSRRPSSAAHEAAVAELAGALRSRRARDARRRGAPR